MPKRQCTVQRFWKCVDKRGPDDCWPWKGPAKKVKGIIRGKFRIGNKEISAVGVVNSLQSLSENIGAHSTVTSG